ncbi:hypothetical protein [Hymenobacter sp. YC55]|uniref:hypothetical protein n=1 Tax=Hymenobacter sp. YC55 TaxID=3034019 RepID=UPI0023F9B317|nr:hypothetical protein [Hymenobacter sp. YC55]MDF7811916.1 hypothetical protein [Hymenobacter sp. YC55]
MATRFIKLSAPVLVAFTLLVAYCTSNPFAPTTAEAQTIGNAISLVKPDHPGGKGHTKKEDKEALKKLTANYTAVQKPSADKPRAFYIDRSVIEEILKQTDCKGLRIYPAYASKTAPFKPRLIVVGVGVGPNGDMLDQITTYEDKGTWLLKECTVIECDDKCPNNCDGTTY